MSRPFISVTPIVEKMLELADSQLVAGDKEAFDRTMAECRKFLDREIARNRGYPVNPKGVE